MSLKFTAGDLTIHRLIEEETTYEEWRTLATTRPCGARTTRCQKPFAAAIGG